jgi:hypothetical protein
MFLSGVLFAAVILTAAAAAWLIARPVRHSRPRPRVYGAHRAVAAAAARERHPASRARAQAGPTVPVGPDDDAEFLLMLDRLISGNPEPGE